MFRSFANFWNWICLSIAGPDNLPNLKKIAQQYQRQESAGAEEEDEDDVPDLVDGESFEDAAKQETVS